MCLRRLLQLSLEKRTPIAWVKHLAATPLPTLQSHEFRREFVASGALAVGLETLAFAHRIPCRGVTAVHTDGPLAAALATFRTSVTAVYDAAREAARERAARITSTYWAAGTGA